ncbi:MAG: DUF2231 domain-containing protein [Methylotetracoccus sp.]
MSAAMSEFLPGLAAMSNVHPLFVHLPIALLLSFVIAESLAWITGRTSLVGAASWMLYFGTVGAAATVATGLLASESVEHDEVVHLLMERHEAFGIAVLGLAALLSVWRLMIGGRMRGLARALHLAVGFLMVGLMMAGADLGGLMVYGHATAVRLPPAPELATPQPMPPPDSGLQMFPPVGAPPDAPTAPASPPPHKHTHHGHKHEHTH